MEEIVNYKIIAKGRVQGVGYRAFVSSVAREMELKGYVQNKFDGTVLIEAEGKEEVLDMFVLKCRQGPGWARIERIDFKKSQPEGFSEFKVKY